MRIVLDYDEEVQIANRDGEFVKVKCDEEGSLIPII